MAIPNAVRTINKRQQALRIELLAIEKRREEIIDKLEKLAAAAEVLHGQRQGSIPIGRHRRWLFRRGELQRFVCVSMRSHGANQSNREIALQIIDAKGWDAENYELINHLRGKVKNVRTRLAGTK